MKFDAGRSLRLAADLRRLQQESRDSNPAWNPSGVVIVRIMLEERMPNTQRSTSAINAFVRRARFDFAGATLPTIRLFQSSLGNLSAAAAEFENKPLSPNGKAFIGRYVGIKPGADIAREVCKADRVGNPLEIWLSHPGRPV